MWPRYFTCRAANVHFDIQGQIGFPKAIKNLSKVFKMLLKSMAKDNDIVNIHNAAFCDGILEFIIHHLLECYGSIFEAKV